MKYAQLDNIGTPLSRLVYGTPSAAARGDFEAACETYEMAYEMGFRVFDTAHSYGKGEESLGKWLARSGHREDVVILDKGCNPSTLYMEPDAFTPETIREQLKQSLERLQTDRVEMYILHRDDPNMPADPIVEVLSELHEEGLIGRFGGSNWTLERTIAANAYAKSHGLQEFSVCSPNYTYMRLINDPWGGSVTLTGRAAAAHRQWLADNQMPVFNYSALARGFLSGKYHSDNRQPVEECLSRPCVLEYYAPENIERLHRAEQLAAELGVTVPQIGMAWLMKQPLNLFPLVTPSSEKHMKETIEGLHIPLSEQQLAWLDAVEEK